MERIEIESNRGEVRRLMRQATEQYDVALRAVSVAPGGVLDGDAQASATIALTNARNTVMRAQRVADATLRPAGVIPATEAPQGAGEASNAV